MLRERPGAEGQPLDDIARLCSASHLFPLCGGGRAGLLSRVTSVAVPGRHLLSQVAYGALPGWRLVAVSLAGHVALGGRLLVLLALEYLHRDARHGTGAAGRLVRPQPRLDARKLGRAARRLLRGRGRANDGREL